MKSLFELKLSVLYLSNVNVNAICGYTLLTSLSHQALLLMTSSDLWKVVAVLASFSSN